MQMVLFGQNDYITNISPKTLILPTHLHYILSIMDLTRGKIKGSGFYNFITFIDLTISKFAFTIIILNY